MAQVFDAAKLEETFNGALFNEYKSHEVTTLAELAQDFEYQQAQWLPIAPPSTEFWGWTQTAGPSPMPFNPEGFPKDFVAGLVPAYRNGVTVYPLTVWEDPKTRDRVFFNAESKEIGSIPAPQGYDPRWSLHAIYPNLVTRSWTMDYINILALIYEPSHLLIRYDLILEDDLVTWVLVQSIRASLRAQAGTGGGSMMMKWQGGTVTNIQFVDIQKETNGCMTVTLAYPEQYQTNANTAFEFFTCDGGRGLLDSWWDLGITTNVNASTNWISWTDRESSNTYKNVRFYAAAVTNDADGDGFTDGFEKYLCHTDPTNANSHPVSVSGTISYTGSLTGPIRMIAVTSSNSWVGCMATMASLGAYTNAKVDNGMSPSSSNTYYSLPFTEGFETNTVQSGSISNQNGWIAWPTNKAVVVTNNAHSGQQALALQESFDVVSAYHLFGTHGLTNVWVDCWMKFNPSNTVRYCETPDLSDAPAWQACFFAVNDRNQIVAYNGNGTNSSWLTCTNVTVSSSYHRYTVRQDYTTKTWDMYFDGTNIFSALGFRDNTIVEFSRFSLTGAWNQDVYIDDVSIGTNQPSGLTQ